MLFIYIIKLISLPPSLPPLKILHWVSIAIRKNNPKALIWPAKLCMTWFLAPSLSLTFSHTACFVSWNIPSYFVQKKLWEVLPWLSLAHLCFSFRFRFKWYFFGRASLNPQSKENFTARFLKSYVHWWLVTFFYSIYWVLYKDITLNLAERFPFIQASVQQVYTRDLLYSQHYSKKWMDEEGARENVSSLRAGISVCVVH